MVLNVGGVENDCDIPIFGASAAPCPSQEIMSVVYDHREYCGVIFDYRFECVENCLFHFIVRLARWLKIAARNESRTQLRNEVLH
ncbi:MAG: hypothetical protein BGN89_13190 [Alphaproteobacteria bacterium 64-6]|nr:MAG: hypothetical protein BGN89_13190 [Alphaproteobacteria bacterium 64-6]